MRVIFVGYHNKPHMAPLDSGTKTGKLIDRVINKLPDNIEIVKTNILDTEEPVSPNKIYKYASEWYWTHLPVSDDIIVLLGNITQIIHKNNVKQIGEIIRTAHPASKRSHKDMDEYVFKVSNKIKKLINPDKTNN